MQLYLIDKAIEEAFINSVDEETGEVLDTSKIDELFMKREQKIENIACYIKNLKSDSIALKQEESNFSARRKVTERHIENLENYLKTYLQGEKFKSAKANITYRNSERVVVPDVKALMKKFQRFAEPTANKTLIKEALKGGYKVCGASLETHQSMIIK